MIVLDKGRVELVDHMGSDLAVVQAARISNGAVMPEARGEADDKLIRFLAKHGHLTPFEHATFKFFVKAPIFVAREWQRHRTFSYNEISGRYKELEPEFYQTNEFRVPDPDNKQSSTLPTVGRDHLSVRLDDDFDKVWWHTFRRERYNRSCQESFEAYKELLSYGVAREMARMVLPLSTYTEFYVTGNLRNWMHFIGLRATEEAQYEIRVYAHAILTMLEKVMPVSVAALRNNP